MTKSNTSPQIHTTPSLPIGALRRLALQEGRLGSSEEQLNVAPTLQRGANTSFATEVAGGGSSSLLGITGGIGSGKSYVSRLLQSLYNIPVYDCDREARRLMVESLEIRQQLVELIGGDAYTADGQLNKPVIASYLFASASHSAKVNAIVHPVVKADFLAWAEEQLRTGVSKHVAVESAILIEAGFADSVDTIIVVEAPVELRIQRAMQRDGCTEEQVRERMNQQLTDSSRRSYATHIIINDGRDIAPQLAALNLA